MGRASGQARTIAISATVLAGFAISLALLYPGHYPFDSAYQYWQARTGEFSNITPVPMIGLWSILIRLFGDPASLLFLNLLMFWTGMGLCFQSRILPIAVSVPCILLCGLSPLVLMQMAHLLSDAHLASLLMLATGLFASFERNRSRLSLWMAWILVIYAGCIRQNALIAIIAFGGLATALLHSSVPHRKRTIWVGATATALVALALGGVLDRNLAVERRPLWPMLALWDLAAISVATDQLLLPEFTHGPGLSVAELKESRAFDPVSAAPLFARSKSGVGSGFITAYTPEQRRQLARAWWSGVSSNPREYLAHRLRVVSLLFGRHDTDTAGLAYYAARTGFRDNPELPGSWIPGNHDQLVNLADKLRPTWLFSALPYLLAHLMLFILACRGREQPRAAIVLTVTASSLLYAGSFVILSPSAELRFLTWPIVSAPLALLLWFAPMHANTPLSAE